MGFALFDEVGGQFPLGQQRVGCNDLAFDIADGIEQWNDHADFIGLLDFLDIAFYRQTANFFWAKQTLLSWPTALRMCV